MAIKSNGINKVINNRKKVIIGHCFFDPAKLSRRLHIKIISQSKLYYLIRVIRDKNDIGKLTGLIF